MPLGLWYLPVGTLVNGLAFLLLFVGRKVLPPRPRLPMPDFIRDVLNARGLMDVYLSRPPYQQNDYISWVQSAKLESTRQKRFHQVLDELKQGGVYMKMKWNPK